MPALNDEWLVIAFRLCLAVVVGGLIGLNRDLHRKAAGVRTHALVALGSALMVLMVMSPGGSDEAHHYDALSRVIQGILTGIGFLGAGVILRNPGRQHISGLTTAATIWLTALLGVACGFGQYVAVFASLVLGVLVLMYGGRLEHAFEARFQRVKTGEPPGTPDP